MIEPQKKELPGKIDGVNGLVTYTVTPLAALAAMRLAVKLAKTFGGGLAGVAGNGVAGLMDMDVGRVIEGVLNNLDEDATPGLIVEILKGTQRNGVYLNADTIDKIYTQNFGELLEALKFTLDVNFGGFIGALVQASSITGNGQPTNAAAEK